MQYTSPHLGAALVIGLGVGVLGTKLLSPKQVPTPQQTPAAMMHHNMSGGTNEMSMDGMTAALQPLEGEAREKKFLELMIEHHQGAVEMAELVLDAPHQEVRGLASEIITTQKFEIEKMRSWLDKFHNDSLQN